MFSVLLGIKAVGMFSSRGLLVCPVCCEEEGQVVGPLVETSWYVQYVVREMGGWKFL